ALAAGSGSAVPACRWCGRPAVDWACGHCGFTRLRASVVGAGRTAEELGRAFPGVPVRTSGGATVLTAVPGEPALVVATPGAEPRAAGGYGAALLLDGWALLSRPDLRAGEEALRRWANAAALVRPGPDGGRVVLGADAGLPVVQALVRWDPAGFAGRELAERTELGFPPARRFASLTGTPDAIADLLAAARLPGSAEPLGPVPAGGGPGGARRAGGGQGGAGRAGGAGGDRGGAGGDRVGADAADLERLLLRVPRSDGLALAAALHAAAAIRSARKAPDPVRVQLDPLALF
ncbi:MAG TPA: primosome assembly protein PriA, partial [Mycobacteriales bacterium]|nr:primosome assembly protein PriA [Mycobacteriales bacterium]